MNLEKGFFFKWRRVGIFILFLFGWIVSGLYLGRCGTLTDGASINQKVKDESPPPLPRLLLAPEEEPRRSSSSSSTK